MKNSFQNQSSDEKISKELVIYYEDPLNKRSYTNKLIYQSQSSSKKENKNTNRQPNVIWFTHQTVKNVAARIDQSLEHLRDTHLPKTKKLLLYIGSYINIFIYIYIIYIYIYIYIYLYIYIYALYIENENKTKNNQVAFFTG